MMQSLLRTKMMDGDLNLVKPKSVLPPAFSLNWAFIKYFLSS